MKHLATYMLLVMGGNSSPTKEDIANALDKVGVEIDEVRLDRLLEVLRDVDHDDLNALLETGKESLAKFRTPTESGEKCESNTTHDNANVEGSNKANDDNKNKDDDDSSVASAFSVNNMHLFENDGGAGEGGDY